MPDKSILDAVAEQVGMAVFPIPLNVCRVTRPYLLERAGIPADATVLFFSVPYLIAADARAPERNLSLYAVPRDYHLYIRQLSDRALPALRGRGDRRSGFCGSYGTRTGHFPDRAACLSGMRCLPPCLSGYRCGRASRAGMPVCPDAKEGRTDS